MLCMLEMVYHGYLSALSSHFTLWTCSCVTSQGTSYNNCGSTDGTVSDECDSMTGETVFVMEQGFARFSEDMAICNDGSSRIGLFTTIDSGP